jgi:hypothetical protein
MSAPNKPARGLNGLRRAYRAICDRCGVKYYNWQLKEEWTGLMVCHGPETHDCWEARHEQDFIRPVKEDNSLPWTRPEPDDVEAYPAACSIPAQSGFIGHGTIGCMRVGWTGTNPPLTYENWLNVYICDVNAFRPWSDFAQTECTKIGLNNG